MNKLRVVKRKRRGGERREEPWTTSGRDREEGFAYLCRGWYLRNRVLLRGLAWRGCVCCCCVASESNAVAVYNWKW